MARGQGRAPVFPIGLLAQAGVNRIAFEAGTRISSSAGGGHRTHTPLAGPRILSPVRLPVPPPRHVVTAWNLPILLRKTPSARRRRRKCEASYHRTMTDNVVEALILDLVEWLAARERTYDEVMDAWRTSCPKLPVWEDATDRGLVRREHRDGRCVVTVSQSGRALLDRRRTVSR